MLDDLNPVDVTPETLGNRDDVAKIRDFLQAKRERERKDRAKIGWMIGTAVGGYVDPGHRTDDPEAA